MASPVILVFGAAGQVGSATARHAKQYGAMVHLAMRNPQKPIPALSSGEGVQEGYQRVRADLTDSQSVHDAVRQTGATRAFIYLAHRSPDNMKSVVQALKSAGVEFVVFLSSQAVKGDPQNALPENFVPWTHAQVEIALEEEFGRENFVALRPAFFASNALWWKTMIQEGEVRLATPDAEFDWITPGDIGSVAAALLVNALKEKPKWPYLYLYGPKLVSLRDGLSIIAEILGKEIKFTQVDKSEVVNFLEKRVGMPEPMARQLADAFERRAQRSDGEYSDAAYKDDKGNISRYTGRPGMILKDWVS
ncbi:hypothetical protein NM208_g5500 [Fusarium decemcellulare]|uniref:Uncharacterized protein n=1 Tax=Fusarium decemcellulare TaxID=57161 RepID=A0ACC1SGU5_9HYPO|nr:hypothetical protein NM208_g5500 [Fusarium decemcellulare]